jgi:hypothetical protein
MTDEERLKIAAEFTERVKTMSIEQVGELVGRFCGDRMTMFMINYATASMARKFTLDNAQSLMLMGYLLRANEDRSNIFQGPAQA